MLFSATQTRKVEDLSRISLKKEPLYIGVDDRKDSATVEGLEQVIIEDDIANSKGWTGDKGDMEKAIKRWWRVGVGELLWLGMIGWEQGYKSFRVDIG